MEKKNKKRLGVVAVVAAAVLAVGATAGTTLAKYITTGEQISDTATVAKWGYVISADASKLFGEKYAATTGDIITEGTGVIVSGTTGTNVVAPGAHGEATITINGTSEVAAILTINLTQFETICLYEDESPIYYPLTWTVGSEELKGAAATKDALGGKIATAVGNSATYSDGVVTAYLPAGTSLSISVKIGWKWEFGEEGNTVGTNDTNDTYLGWLAAGEDGTEFVEDKEYTSDGNVTLALQAIIAQTMKGSLS